MSGDGGGAAHLVAQEVEHGEALVDRIGAEQRQVGHERRELAAVVVVRRKTLRGTQRLGLHVYCASISRKSQPVAPSWHAQRLC